MLVASWESTKSATVARLSPSALYLLSSAEVPNDYLAGILSRVDAGEHVAPALTDGGDHPQHIFLHSRVNTQFPNAMHVFR